jgi:hypothetical protein
MGQKVKLLGGPYEFELPPLPTDETQILFHEKKKKDQYWIAPDLTVYKRLKISEKRDFVNQIREWWLNGLWFMNNGEPTYITGLHFDFLTLHTFNSIEGSDKRPRFYESQRHDFYFRELTWSSPKCYGRIFYKPRRYGMTLQEIAEMYYRAVGGFGRNVGCMSNEYLKTLSSLFQPLVSSMMKRPKYMRAKYYSPNNKVPRKQIEFTGSTIPNEDEDGDQDQYDEYLEGWIRPKTTTVAAFDGDKASIIVIDELFKFTSTSPKETVAAHKKSIEVGGRPIGKISALSTMGDSDDYIVAVKEGVQMYYESDPEVLDGNGNTANGLWHYFVSGIYMMNENHADKYGKLNEDAAMTEIMNTRANFTPGTKDYIFECRRVPLRIEDALASATFSNIFDKHRIDARLTILRKTPRDKLPFVEGIFEEENNGRVHWVPDSNGGPWKLAWKPLINKNIDTTNRWYRDYDNKLHPRKNIQYGCGYDPVRIAVSDAKSNNLSKASILIKQKFDYYGNGGANRFAALYLYRPEDPNEPTYQCYLACKYFGCRAMIERNVEKPREWFKGPTLNPIDIKWDKIYAADLMEIGDDGFYGTAIHGRTTAVKDGVDMIQTSIKKPKPDTDEVDWLMEIPFIPLLTDMNEFDPKKTTLYDCMMANIQLEYSLKKIKFTNISDDTIAEEPPKGINAMVPGRKNSVMP